MSHAPVRILHSLPLSNHALVYRTCRECQMELCWPIKQSSITHCPYCQTPYRQPPVRARIQEWATKAAVTALVFMGVIGFVGLLVRIGSRLFV